MTDMLHFHKLTCVQLSPHSIAKIPLCISGFLMQNDESGCTLMRCKFDWLEIWTLNHGPNQSQTFRLVTILTFRLADNQPQKPT